LTAAISTENGSRASVRALVYSQEKSAFYASNNHETRH